MGCEYPSIHSSNSILWIRSFIPETVIFDILNYYKNGAKGKPIVPKELLEASPYNQGILEILKQIYDRRVK